MNERERALLIEDTIAAWRPHGPDGQILAHPAWADLDPDGREEAFEESLVMRVLEAALDPEGYSTTVRAVLSTIVRE
jgi:hypothetical protein